MLTKQQRNLVAVLLNSESAIKQAEKDNKILQAQKEALANTKPLTQVAISQIAGLTQEINRRNEDILDCKFYIEQAIERLMDPSKDQQNEPGTVALTNQDIFDARKQVAKEIAAEAKAAKANTNKGQLRQNNRQNNNDIVDEQSDGSDNESDRSFGSTTGSPDATTVSLTSSPSNSSSSKKTSLLGAFKNAFSFNGAKNSGLLTEHERLVAAVSKFNSTSTLPQGTTKVVEAQRMSV